MNVARLPKLPEEPAAHMYPCDLAIFRRGEHTATAFSIAVGSPDYGKSEPLFTAAQLIAAMAQAAREQRQRDAALCWHVHKTTGECPELALYCEEAIRSQPEPGEPT